MRLLARLTISAVLLLRCSLGAAQEPPSPAGTVMRPAAQAEKPAARSVQVEEIKPPLYYLKDKDGQLQAVPGFTLEEFERLYRLKEGLEDQAQPALYHFEEITVSGSAVGDRAELDVAFRLRVHSEDWVRVPLRLETGILSGEVKYEGPGEQFLEFKEGGEGYVSWVRGKVNEDHRLTLRVLVPLERIGGETCLALRLPRAARCGLRVSIPLEGIVARVSEDAILQPPASEGKGTTTLRVLGRGGPMQLAWQEVAGRAAETPAALDSVGAIVARLDDHSANIEAALTVRSYSAAFDRFRVRLAPGAELVAGNDAGYTIAPVGTEVPSGKEAEGADRRLVEVRLAARTTGPIEVRLGTRQTIDPAKGAKWFELAGFDVVGAARQSGHIAIEAAGDWHLVRGPSRGVRQVEELPKALRHEGLIAGFEYFGQPCSLTARVVPRKTRMSVEPQYVLLVDAEQMSLEARLKYTVRGAKASSLAVKMGDWEFDEVGPENLVAVDGVEVGKAQMLSIPLLQASTGEIEVVIKAHRRIPPGAKSLMVRFPQPQSNLIGPAAVVVIAADDVELTPDAKAVVGLIRQQAAPPMQMPHRQQEPLFYRGDSAEAVFAAAFRTHQQKIGVDVSTRVRLDRGTGGVEQKIAYTIAYEPLDRLTFQAPRKLALSSEVEFSLDGNRLFPVVSPEVDEGTGPVEMRLALPEARIGTCELVVRYPLESISLLPRSSVVRTIPLVMPTDGELVGNRLSISAPATLQIQLREGPWEENRQTPRRPSPRQDMELSASQRAEEVVLGIHLEERDPWGTTVVEKAWVQTWLTQDARQDRAAFRFLTARKSIELGMPTGVSLETMELVLDGTRPSWQATPEGRLLIPLPAAATNAGVASGESDEGEHFLELRYHFLDPRPPRGAMALEIPRLGDGAWVRRMYWQWIFPRDEDIVCSPAGLTAEYRWAWNGMFWGREPLWEQRDLEGWIGAPPRTGPPGQTNKYLFSGLGTVSRCELHTMSRAWIVLGASGAALVAGLLLIYLPVSRHPSTLLILAIGLVAAGILYPEPMLLLAQAASVGLGLTLLAGLLQRSVLRQRRRVVVPEPSSSVIETDSTQTQYRMPIAGPQASTGTAPSQEPLSFESDP